MINKGARRCSNGVTYEALNGTKRALSPPSVISSADAFWSLAVAQMPVDLGGVSVGSELSRHRVRISRS
jgi:hypothetical protein